MTTPRILMNAWQLKPVKQLGQHFLSDKATAAAIVQQAAIGPQDHVLEIGSGLGALTTHLCRAADTVVAVEKDPKIVRLLKAELSAARCENVEILQRDILHIDIQNLAAKAQATLSVVGNLPYQLSSPILLQLIQTRASLKKAVLMFQKELAARFMAQPGGKSYGRLSVILQYCARVKPLLTVKASCFYPKPKVDSLVLDIAFLDRPARAAHDEAFFIAVIKAAFAMRRKTLKNALSNSQLKIDARIASGALKAVGIHPSRRAETLSVDEFVRLGNQLYGMI